MGRCNFCQTEMEQVSANAWVCRCHLCVECGTRNHEDELDDNNHCEECRKKAYREAHECESCGDIYEGNLIDVGKNAGGYACNYCPSCVAFDVTHEIGLMGSAVKANDKEAHRLAVLETMEKLKAELIRGHDDN